MIRKIIAAVEVIVGLCLLFCVFINGKTNSFTTALGIEANVSNAVILTGIFFVLKSLIDISLAAGEEKTTPVFQRLVMFTGILTGFVLVLSGLCDTRETIIEEYFQVEIIANHGVVVLATFFATKAVSELVAQDSSV